MTKVQNQIEKSNKSLSKPKRQSRIQDTSKTGQKTQDEKQNKKHNTEN